MRRGTALLLLLLVPGCATGHAGRIAGCPGLSITVDPVTGDVNETFLRAVVTQDGARAAGTRVSFRIRAADDSDVVWTLSSPRTGPDGAAYFDLGAYVLDGGPHAAAVTRGGEVFALVRRPTADECAGLGAAPFRPTLRLATAPPSVAADVAGLRRALRRFVAAVPEDAEVARLPDGRSACRLLHAVAADVKRHPRWLKPDERESVVSAAQTCATNLQEAAGFVRVVLY